MPWTGAVGLCDVPQTPIDLYGGIVTVIGTERSHFVCW